ncbi:MAG: hypothetical protein ACJAXJ_003762 [Colwellia sp.]|jgi:hypothetical protein
MNIETTLPLEQQVVQKVTSTFTLGQSVNLLYGYNPVWNPNTSKTYPFFCSPTKSVVTVDNPDWVAQQYPAWSNTPTITIHENLSSILSTLYAYNAEKMVNDSTRGVKIPVGPLALNDADSQAAAAAAAEFLGIDVKPGFGYMLVTMSRIDAIATHPFASGQLSKDRSEYLTADAKQIISKLTPAATASSANVLYNPDLTTEEAKAYITSIYQIGSHFVSEIASGDKIIQVFTFAEKDFQIITENFANDAVIQADGSMAVTDVTASGWEYYTSALSKGYSGVSQYGKLLCLSRDPALQTSIAQNDWENNYVPAGTPSIFAATHQYKIISGMTESVPVALNMMPIANLISALMVAAPWDRLIKGGLLQKYGDAVQIPLDRPLDYDWQKIFPQTVDSWTSSLVTPTIDIYQERIDLAKVELLGESIVSKNFAMQSFTSFSQVLQATTVSNQAPIDLPSDNVCLIAQIIDMTQAVQTPVLKMSVKALKNVKIFCEVMYGALILEDSKKKRQVALDGFLFETLVAIDPGTERSKVDLSGVLVSTPDAATIMENKQSIEFSVVAGQTLLQAQGANSEEIRGLEQSYLLWLAGIIPIDTPDIDLANNRARALYLARNIADIGGDAIYVPYVTYESYNKYVGDMVAQAKTLQGQIQTYQIQITDTVNAYKTLDSIENLNDNVKQIGGVLTSYFGVLAAGRQSMNGYYDSIIGQLDAELQETLKNITDLSTKLQSQQAVISHTGKPVGIIQQFEDDYSDYSRDLIAQCVMSGVESLFSLGIAMAAVPGEAAGGVVKALKAIEDVSKKLKAVMKVLAQLQAIEGIASKAGDINTLSNTIGALTENLKMPTQVELQTLSLNVKAALVGVPDTGSLNQDKANLIAAVDTLVIVGSALLDAQAKASQIQVEIANNNRLKTINGQQEYQLTGLKNQLNLNNSSKAPNINDIDLIGVSGQLQYQLKQVLSRLAQVLVLQNGAIEYQYFGNPVEITSFSLVNLQNVISVQDNQIIHALQNLNPQPQKVNKPIKITVKDVVFSKLINGNVFQLPVHLCNTELYNYDMVRIDRVIPNIIGIKSTLSDSYEIHLSSQAKPFQDRNYSRNAITYATMMRKFGPYVYDVSSGDAEFGTNTGSFADQTTHITPFTIWEISLPGDVKNNKGIEFDSLLVDIELEFYITAHYDDPVEHYLAKAKSLQLMQKGHYQDDLVAPMALMGVSETPILMASKSTTALTASSATTPSLINLESQMYQNEAVLQNWDAVFNVLEGPVNAFLYQQFQQYIQQISPGTDTNLMEISAYFCDNVSQFQGKWFTNVTQMKFQLSNPLLNFVAGNNSATVIQNLLSGTIKTGTMSVTETDFEPGKCLLIDGVIDFTVDTSNSLLTLSVGHVFEKNMLVQLTTTGTLPAPLKVDTDYWIVNWVTSGDTTTLQLADIAKGEAITLTDVGTGTQTITPQIYWGDPMQADLSNSPYIKASVPLASLSGIVEPPAGQGTIDDTHTVFLDFPTGAFTLNHFEVDPPNWDPSHHATNISNSLANYFATHDIKYQVQTINYKNLSQDVALKPTAFMLNATTTNSGNNVLQILIATTGDIQHANTIQLNEPVPYDPSNPIPGVSDFNVSLMISTKIMFNNIFVDSFNQSGTDIQVEAIDPGKDFEAWSAKITTGNAKATAQFKNHYDVSGIKVKYRISASSNSLDWPLDGLTFTRSEDAGLLLNYTNGTANPISGGRVVNFQYQQYISGQTIGGAYIPGQWGSWQDSSATAYITMTGSYPLEVSGSGAAQLVKFTTTEPIVDFDKASDLKPASGCECNDNAIKIALLNSLGEAVPATLKAYLDKITFQPISVFSLENLLFPADQLITMQQARVPADLLVVGSFLAKVRKTATEYDVTVSASSGAKGVFSGISFQNGVGTGSATKPNLPKKFTFTYGPIDPVLGNPVDHTIDIESGSISPPLLVVVTQPDPVNNPGKVILLPPGFHSTAS